MTTDEIKNQISIEQALSTMYDIKIQGVSDCPIHGGDKCFSIKKNQHGNEFFKCFSCGASGDIFNLVQTISSVDFAGAKKLICDCFNSPILNKADRKKRKAQLEQLQRQKHARQILQKLRRYQQDRICQVLREIRTEEGDSFLEKHLEALLHRFDQRAEFFITHDIHAHLNAVLMKHLKSQNRE